MPTFSERHVVFWVSCIIIFGGLLLVLFATMAGVIYGLAWLWSGRLWVATLVHFSFNMLHLLLFTYPFWQHIPT